jgi:hypothetical protein
MNYLFIVFFYGVIKYHHQGSSVIANYLPKEYATSEKVIVNYVQNGHNLDRLCGILLKSSWLQIQRSRV